MPPETLKEVSSMAKYTAEIKHSEATIRAMAKAQFDAFRPVSYTVMLLVSLLLLGAALFWQGASQPLKIIMIMIGSFTIVGLNTPSKQLADQVIKSLNGKFPRIGYAFGEDSVQLTGAVTGNTLLYSDILRLVESKEYLYIFIQNKSAYMIDRGSIRPDAEALMAFVAEKTGLPWTRNTSILNISLKTIRQQWEDNRLK